MAPPALLGQVVPVSGLGDAELREHYRLFARHYDNVSWEVFARDFREKDFVILLREGPAGPVRGFSTQKLLKAESGGRALRALYSGDTIIDRERWGEQELVRAWCRFAGALWAEEPALPLYWFLICKGYRTYLYLPVFFKDYFPRWDASTPPPIAGVIDALARLKFPASWRPERGLLEFPESLGNLNPELAEIPAGRLKDERVRFFLERNPDYARGSELVCLTEISAANMRGLALRLFEEGRALGGVPALAEKSDFA